MLRTFVDGARTATEVAAALGITKGGDVTAAIAKADGYFDAIVPFSKLLGLE